MSTLEMRKRELIGAGGGGKGGGTAHVAKEDPDTLVSRQEARIKEILSEGECGGPSGTGPLVNGMKSVALGDGNTFTPIQNADGSYNYTNFDFFIVPGTQDQSYIPNFDASEATTAVGVRVRHANAWESGDLNNTDWDAVRVDLRFPRMETQNKKTGDTHGASVNITIALKQFGGSYVTVINDTVTGKGTSPYIRTYKIELPQGHNPWSIQVTRVTADSTSEAIQDQTWVDSYTTVTYGKLRNPNTVTAGIAIDAEQFGQIPVRTYYTYGKLIKVPTNYNPVTAVYTGIWDGTFKTAFSNNPAWCFYEMLTDPRWGMGKYLDESKIDKASLYSISKYCDGLVSDGHGGQERRFTCSLYLQQRAQALEVMRNMASIFRGILYYGGGTVVPVIDAPIASPNSHYTLENIIDGRFTYSRASRSARHTVAYVTWNDNNNFGKSLIEPVEIHDDVRDRGIIPLNVTKMGCTSRAEAHRYGLAILLSERLDRFVAFSTGQEGNYDYPGALTQTHDPFKAGKKLGGRIKTATTSSVTIDQSITIESGKTYALQTFKADGSVDRRNMTNGIGTTSVLTVTPSYTAAPAATTTYVVAVSDIQPEQWRVVKVTPKDLATVDIVALEYNTSKWAAIEHGLTLLDPPISILPNPAEAVTPPGTVTVKAIPVLTTSNIIAYTLHVSWIRSTDRYIKDYVIRYRYQNGNWRTLTETDLDVDIPNAKVGKYDFEVYARNILLKKSAPAKASYTLNAGDFIPRFTVTGLELVGQGNNTTFQQRDAKFQWRINSAFQSEDIGSESNGASAGIDDPMFANFRIEIYNGATRIWGPFFQKSTSFTFTYEKNAEAMKPAKAIPTFQIQVAAIDKNNNVSAPAKLTVTNPAPPAPTNFVVTASFRAAFLVWNDPDVVDLDRIEVWYSPTGNFSGATRIANAAKGDEHFNQSGLTTGTTVGYWLVAKDTFGNPSPFTAGAFVTPGTVGATDLGTFAIDASRIFSNVAIPVGDVWVDNSNNGVAGSAPGYLWWNAHKVYHKGVGYNISIGSTNLKYVYWKVGNTAYTPITTNPADTVAGWNNNTYFQIAINNGGTHELAWYGFANAVIGSAYIKNAAIVNALIANLSVDDAKIINAGISKLAAGSVTANTVATGALTTDKFAVGLGSSLTLNPSFEENNGTTPTSWTLISGATLSTVESHSGAYSIRTSLSVGLSGVRSTLAVPVGKKDMLVSVAIKSPATYAAQLIRFGVRQFTQDGVTPSATQTKFRTATATSLGATSGSVWAVATYVFTPDADCAFVKLDAEANVDSAISGAYCYFDDFVLLKSIPNDQLTIIDGGKITTGQIKSNNYSSGTAGWMIDLIGNLEMNSGIFRGILTLGGAKLNSNSSGDFWIGNSAYADALLRLNHYGLLTYRPPYTQGGSIDISAINASGLLNPCTTDRPGGAAGSMTINAPFYNCGVAYTTDGTDPSDSGSTFGNLRVPNVTVMSRVVTITPADGATVKARPHYFGRFGPLATWTFDAASPPTPTAPGPSISPLSGPYTNANGKIAVNFSTILSGGTVRRTFTTDGSEPADPTGASSSGNLTNMGPGIITVKAITTKSGYNDSVVVRAQYTVTVGGAYDPGDPGGGSGGSIGPGGGANLP